MDKSHTNVRKSYYGKHTNVINFRKNRPESIMQQDNGQFSCTWWNSGISVSISYSAFKFENEADC